MALDALVLRGLRTQDERHSGLPLDLITGTGAVPRPRMRVDPGDTAFYEGRQFLAAYEFNLTAGSSMWLRFITPVDCIIKNRALTVVQGNVRAQTQQGGTPAGTWTAGTVIPANIMASRPTPLYVGQVQTASGGTVSPGVVVSPPLVLETGNNVATSVHNVAPEQGLPPGTFYTELRNTGSNAGRGVYTVLWEEVAVRSAVIY